MPLFSAMPGVHQHAQRTMQSVEMLTLSEWIVQFSTVPYNLIHSNDQPWVSTLRRPKARLRVSESRCVVVIEMEWVAGPVSPKTDISRFNSSTYAESAGADAILAIAASTVGSCGKKMAHFRCVE